MAFDAGALIAKLKLDTKGFQLGAQQATGQMNKMQTKAQGLSKVLGKALAIGALGALVVGLKKAVSAAGEFEASMANVSTLVDTATTDINELSKAVVDMTSEVLKSADDLSAGLYQVFSAGVTDSAEAMDVLRVSAIAATAGLSDTRSSVDAITTIINAYGLQTQEATRVSDLMFQTVKLGKTTFNELAGSIGTVIAPAASLGIELEDLFAALATLTKGGFDTRVATTALRATFISVLKPSEDALKTAKRIGLQWDANALKAKGLVQFINDMRDATQGNTKEMASLIPEARALTSVLALAGAQSETFNKTQKEMFDAIGSTKEAFDKQAKTYDAQKKKFGLLIDSITINIGNKFLPAITRFLAGINSLFDETSQNYKELRNLMSAPIVQATKDTLSKTRKLLDEILFPTGGLLAAINRYKQFTQAIIEETKGIRLPFKETVDGLSPAFAGFVANVKSGFKEIETASKEATKEITTTWDDVPDSVKTAFDELGITSKGEFESQVRTAVGAFEEIVSEQNLTNEEVLQLRQSLFDRIRQLADAAGEEGVLGFNTEEFITKLDRLQQNVINKSTVTSKKVSDVGKTTTIALKTFLEESTQLAVDAVSGIELLLDTELKAQTEFLATVTDQILGFQETRFMVEEAITKKVGEELEEQEQAFKRYVLGIKGLAQEAGGILGLARSVGSPGITPVAEESFAGGIDFVPRDMMANLHQGERVVPSTENTFNQTVNLSTPQGSPQETGRNMIRAFNKLNASNSF